MDLADDIVLSSSPETTSGSSAIHVALYLFCVSVALGSSAGHAALTVNFSPHSYWFLLRVRFLDGVFCPVLGDL